MIPLRRRDPDIDRRGDRSLGWARPLARQCACLERLLASPGFALRAPDPPAPTASLPPFPAAGPGRAAAWARRAAGGLALALAFYVLATSLLVACYRFVNPPATVLMAYRRWGYGWKIEPPRPQPLRRVPAYLRSMLVSVEDGKFYEHHGLDFEAFQNARAINARLGRPLYGGSTLTMQVARTLFLVPVKSYLRKGLEIVVALELELFLPKSRILELYFGYAEWGRGVFGIEAASRKWYGVPAASLSRDQAIRLVALLSSPIRFTPKNLERSAILRERYRYLSARYGSPRPAAPQALPDAQAAEPAAQAAPPPSVEPGADEDSAEAPADAEAPAPPAASDPGAPPAAEPGAASAAVPASAPASAPEKPAALP